MESHWREVGESGVPKEPWVIVTQPSDRVIQPVWGSGLIPAEILPAHWCGGCRGVLTRFHLCGDLPSVRCTSPHRTFLLTLVRGPVASSLFLGPDPDTEALPVTHLSPALPHYRFLRVPCFVFGLKFPLPSSPSPTGCPPGSSTWVLLRGGRGRDRPDRSSLSRTHPEGKGFHPGCPTLSFRVLSRTFPGQVDRPWLNGKEKGGGGRPSSFTVDLSRTLVLQ